MVPKGFPSPWRRQSVSILFALTTTLLPSGPTVHAALALVDKGKSSFRIVIATNALASEHYAAEELQTYLQKMSGAKLPIITDNERVRSREILVGQSAHVQKLGLQAGLEKLGPDSFTILTHGRDLMIAGGQPRGTLNGVHAFLEEKLGVRWFTPELEVVPKTNRIVLPALNETSA